jgi:hypothetical protein
MINITSDISNVRPVSVAFVNCHDATTFGRTVHMTAHEERRLRSLLEALLLLRVCNGRRALVALGSALRPSQTIPKSHERRSRFVLSVTDGSIAFTKSLPQIACGGLIALGFGLLGRT